VGFVAVSYMYVVHGLGSVCDSNYGILGYRHMLLELTYVAFVIEDGVI